MDYMALLSESQQKELKERLSEVQELVGFDAVLEVHFSLQDEQELFVEFSNDEKIVYRLMFKVNQKVGRPSLGTTKKVSITLPDEIWAFIENRKEEWGVSQSQTLRAMIERYYHQEK